MSTSGHHMSFLKGTQKHYWKQKPAERKRALERVDRIKREARRGNSHFIIFPK